MKKRLFAWALLLAMLVSLFAGCAPKDPDPTDAPTQPTVGEADLKALEDALEYIKTVYKNPGELTPKDFQRIGVVPVGGVKYEVVWTVDVGEDIIKIVVGDNGMVTIDVNEEITEEVKYVLTATITDAYGNSVSYSWNHTIPATMSGTDIVDQAYALEPGEALDFESTLTGKIMSIDTPWSEDYQNITVTIVIEGREDKPIQCYRLTGDGAKDLAIGDTITVTGTLKNYNGTIEFDSGCKLDAVVKGDGVAAVAPEDPKQIVAEAYALAPGASLLYTAELTGVITKVNTPWDSGYGNITVTIVVEGCEDQPIMCYRLKGDGAEDLAKGDTITVTGNIKNYNGTIEFVQGCILKNVIPGSRETVSAPTSTQEILNDALALQPGDTLEYQAQLTGVITKKFDWNTTYNDVNLYMDVNGTEIYVYGLKGLSSDILKKGDTLTVYGYITNYNGTIEFNKPTYVSHVPGEGGEEEPTDPVTSNIPAITTSISNGDKVIIYAPAYGVALSTEKAGFYNAGVSLSYSGGVVSGAGSSAIWTVIKNSDGTYSFSNGGQNIGLADSFTSMDLGAVNDDWQLIDLGGGLCNLYNTGREKYMEWYNQYSNWSTYGTSNAASDDQLQISFYIVEAGSSDPVVTDPTDPTETDPTTPTETDPTIPSETTPTEPEAVANAELLTSLPDNGDVIVVYNSGNAMGSAVSGTKMAAVEATVTENVLPVTEEMAQLTVTVDGDNYIFTLDGKYLTSGATGNSLSLADELTDCGKWTIEAAAEGTWYIKNVGANYNGNYNQAMEYYKGFTTYGIKETAIYQMQLFKVVDETVVDPTDPTTPTETDPTTPSESDPTIPSETDPSEPDVTDPSEPDVTEPEATEPAVTAKLMTEKPIDGDIIVITNDTKAMTATASGKKLAAADATIAENLLTVTDEMAQLVVNTDDNGYYTFTVDGKYLTSGETGNSLSLADELTDCGKWTIEAAAEGTWYIKNVGANYNGNYNQALEYYSGFTTYGIKETAIYQMQMFLVEREPAPVELMTEKPGNGDTVIIVNGTNAMGSAVSGKKLAAVAATITDNVLTVTEDMAQLVVTVDGDNYIFTLDGKYLTSGETGNSLSLADELTDCGKWTIEAAAEGTWYIKNVGANYNGNYNQALEYYSGFTTYGIKETAIYQMQLFLVAAGEGTETEPPVDPSEPEATDPTTPSEPETTDPTVPSEPETNSATYTFADYKVDGEAAGYATRDLDDNVSMTISSGLFNTEARIYKSANAVINSKTAMSSIVVNAGYKDSTFVVYVSEDGETWTLYQEDVAYVSGYSDVTITLPEGCKYVKIDAPNAQIRIKYMTVNFA